jgi:hypothetical protein
MKMPTAAVAMMSVVFGFRSYRYGDQPRVTHAPFGNHVIGEVPDLRLLTAQDRHFQAATVVEMHMDGRVRQFVMIVKDIGQTFRQLARVMVIDIDQRRDTIALFSRLLDRLPHARAGKIADGFRPVLVAAACNQSIEFGNKLVVSGNGQALHSVRCGMIFSSNNHTKWAIGKSEQACVSAAHNCKVNWTKDRRAA